MNATAHYPYLDRTAAPAAPVQRPLAVLVESPSHGTQAAEQKRWLTWFGLPALLAAILLATVFGTGAKWLMGPAVVSIIADIGVLIWLALSSDTNGADVEDATPEH